MSNRRTIILLNVALVIITIAVFANTLNNPFVFDDKPAIVHNESIRSFRTAFNPPQTTSVSARPLVNLSYAINYALDDYHVRGYHAVNLALHIGAGLLLFALLRHTLPDRPVSLSFLIALLWLIHPLQTECINYVSQRTELMMGLFYLITLYAAARAFDADSPRRWCTLGVVACAAGMLCKETMVTAPVMVFIWGWVFRREQMFRFRVFLSTLAATWLVLAAVMIAWPRGESVGFGHIIGAWTYLLNQSVMICRYLQLAFYPHPLLIDYGLPQVLSISEVWLECLIIVALIVITIIGLRRKPLLGFAGAWFFILLSPTSSFVPIVTEVGGERRMYLPLLGVILLVTAIPRKLHRSILVIGIILATICGWMSFNRNAQYQDPIDLWASVIHDDPENARAHNNMANHYRDRGNHQRALTHYQLAANLKPAESVVYVNLGNALVKMDQINSTNSHTSQAITAFETALQHDQKDSQALNNLGILMARSKKYNQAEKYFQTAIAVTSDDDIAHFNYARLLLAAGRREAARFHLKKALNANPDNLAARTALKNLEKMHP